MNTEAQSPHPVGSSAWLGDDNIKNTLMRIEETADCSWTELCIKTVQEIGRPLQEEIEKCKVDRNRIGMTERRKYLPEIERLHEIIKRASVRFFEDGTSDGETAAAMLRILDEAKSPNAGTQRPGAGDAPIANQIAPPGSLE